MKKLLLIFLILFSSFLPKKIIAQNNNDAAAVAGAAIGAAIGVMIAIEQMKEQAELEATQYMIANYPELDKFSLQTLDFDGKKISDMSSTSVISYTVTEFDLIDNEPVLGKRMILFGFTSYGWVNNNGVNFNKVMWHLVDEAEWFKMMITYTKLASGEQNEDIIIDALKNGKVENTRVKARGRDNIDFYKIYGDMYLVSDYSSRFKFVYNERTFGIFLKETKDLVQIGRRDLIKFHKFMLGEL
jgi:hypothetical protein